MTTPKVSLSETPIKNCPRCGKEHESVTFHKFKAPMRVDRGGRSKPRVFTHWAICPTTQEPFLLIVKSEVL